MTNKINTTTLQPHGGLSSCYSARSLINFTNTVAIISACLLTKHADAQPGGGFSGGFGNAPAGTSSFGGNSAGGGADGSFRGRGHKGNMNSKAFSIVFYTMFGVLATIPLCYWKRKQISSACYDVYFCITYTLPVNLSTYGSALIDKIKKWRTAQPPTHNPRIEIH